MIGDEWWNEICHNKFDSIKYEMKYSSSLKMAF